MDKIEQAGHEFLQGMGVRHEPNPADCCLLGMSLTMGGMALSALAQKLLKGETLDRSEIGVIEHTGNLIEKIGRTTLGMGIDDGRQEASECGGSGGAGGANLPREQDQGVQGTPAADHQSP